MKEEILKLLNSIDLEVSKEEENYEHYLAIANELKDRISYLEKENENNMFFSEVERVKTAVDEINNAETTFRKFKKINRLQKDISVLS